MKKNSSPFWNLHESRIMSILLLRILRVERRTLHSQQDEQQLHFTSAWINQESVCSRSHTKVHRTVGENSTAIDNRFSSPFTCMSTFVALASARLVNSKKWWAQLSSCWVIISKVGWYWNCIIQLCYDANTNTEHKSKITKHM